MCIWLSSCLFVAFDRESMNDSDVSMNDCAIVDLVATGCSLSVTSQ